MAKGLQVIEKYNFILAVIYSVARGEDDDDARGKLAEAMQLVLDANRIKLGVPLESEGE